MALETLMRGPAAVDGGSTLLSDARDGLESREAASALAFSTRQAGRAGARWATEICISGRCRPVSGLEASAGVRVTTVRGVGYRLDVA